MAVANNGPITVELHTHRPLGVSYNNTTDTKMLTATTEAMALEGTSKTMEINIRIQDTDKAVRHKGLMGIFHQEEDIHRKVLEEELLLPWGDLRRPKATKEDITLPVEA
ncbi:hypothetical protein PT974_01148 [Cladobotryum mycophilum]|uniref:Uncharacterized protein n=1 Tax=Cladobotryum mycophilum TaxID=491253 RepID=A0ABR0T457_9HYPO